jgi:hypothetical protein
MCFMKRMLWMAVLAVPLAAAPAQAQVFHQNPVPPMNLNGGVTLNFNLFAGGGQTQLGPWYRYWPHEAHFVVPPPIGPGMPGPGFMTLPPEMGPVLAPQQQQQQQQQQQPWTPPAPTPVRPGGTQQSAFTPVGYFSTTQAPSYWYGR